LLRGTLAAVRTSLGAEGEDLEQFKLSLPAPEGQAGEGGKRIRHLGCNNNSQYLGG